MPLMFIIIVYRNVQILHFNDLWECLTVDKMLNRYQVVIKIMLKDKSIVLPFLFNTNLIYLQLDIRTVCKYANTIYKCI